MRSCWSIPDAAAAAGEPCADAVVGQLRLVVHHRAVQIRGRQRAAGRDDELDDDRQPIVPIGQRCEVGRQALGQHREDDAGRVDRRRVQCRVPIDRRSFRDRGVDIGNRHQHFEVPVRQRFRHRQLIEIARVVVVDRAPEKGPQIARRLLGRGRRAPGRCGLDQRIVREIGIEAALAHGADGDRAKVGSMRLVGRGSDVGHRWRRARLRFEPADRRYGRI
jgi:hypothetical protein